MILNKIYLAWIILGSLIILSGFYMITRSDMPRGIALIAIGGVCEGLGIVKYTRRPK